MTNEQKADQYGQLLNEHTRLGNRVNAIKGESIDLNREQLTQIQKLQEQQGKIMSELQRMMN